MGNSDVVLNGALVYAAAGRALIPTRPDKSPYTEHGLLDATCDEATIRAWWRRWLDAGIGLLAGPGWWVFEVDNRDSLHDLETRHGFLPVTRRVGTPRGGLHFYFLGDAQCGTDVPVKGIDIRGEGKGYVVAPPTPGYFLQEAAPIVHPPQWLTGLIDAKRKREDRQMTVSECIEVAARGLDGKPPASPVEWWTAAVRDGFEDGQVSSGDGRKMGLIRLIGHLLGHRVDARLAREIAYLVNTRCRPPLPDGDVERVCEWVAERELHKREAR
jgi:hypothetical protein